MKKFLLAVFGLMLSAPLYSQVAAVNGYCSLGGTQSLTSSLKSTNYLNGVVIGCQITPVLTGTTTPAQYSLNASGIPLQTGPFTANTYGSINPGAFVFFAATGDGLDVIASGGVPPNSYPQPVTILTDVIPGGGGGGGSGVCGTAQPNFLSIGVAAGCIGPSPIYTDSTQNETITFPFSSAVNFITRQINLFGDAGVAGSISLKQGTTSAPGANEFELEAPTILTAYTLHPPGAQGAGCWDNDGAGNSSWLLACGAIDLHSAITLPVVGNAYILYPDSVTPTFSGCTTGSGYADGSAKSYGTISATNCSVGGRSVTDTFTFTLPSFITPGNVTAVYCSSVGNFLQFGQGPVLDDVQGCGPTAPFTATSIALISTPFATMQIAPVLSTITGTQITGSGYSLNGAGSTCGVPACGTLGVLTTTITATPFLIIYTTDTLPAQTGVTVNPPLTYTDQGLGADTSWPFPGLYLNPETYANAVISGGVNATGTIFNIIDSTVTSGCIAGGGGNQVFGVWNGSCITVFSSSGGSGSFSALTSGTNTTAAMVVGSGASLGTTGSGTIGATSLTAASALPNGTVATTQSFGDTSTDVATDAFVQNAVTVGDILNCADASGSGTVQVCTTSPSFTPGLGDCVRYRTTTTNSGTGLTLNVNSLGAKGVAIPGASGWTTTLTASIVPAGKPLLACYDNTNWNVQQTGTVSASSSSPLTSKGDLYTYSTTNAREPVGADGTFLEADSTQTNGIKWGTPSGSVTSVSNSDGTLTITPTTGAVVASLALGHTNIWTGLQTLVGTNITGLPLTTGVTGILPVANGGTGTNTSPTDAQLLIGQSGGTYLPKTASGSCTMSDTGVFSCSGGASLPLSTTVLGGGSCHFGDSTGYGGATTSANQVWAVLLAAYGGVGCAGGPLGVGTYYDISTDADSTMLDTLDNQIIPNIAPGDTANPDFFVQAGLVDAWIPNGVAGSGTITNGQATVKAATNTVGAWLGTTQHAKMIATNTGLCTTTGTWTALNTFRSGIALQVTSASGSPTITCTTPYAAMGSIYISYWVQSGGTATGTLNIDSGVTTDTLSSGLSGTIATTPGNSAFWATNRYALTGSGTHTFTITVTAAGSGNPFGFVFAVAPTPTYAFMGLTNPNVEIAGIQYAASNNYQPDADNFNGYIQTTAAQLAADMANIHFVNLRAVSPENSYSPVSSGPFFDFSGGTYNFGTVCPASTAGSPHGGDCLQRWNAYAFLLQAGKVPGGAVTPNNVVTSFTGRQGLVTGQTGDYTCGQVTNAPCTNTANTFNGGTQTIITPNSMTSALVVQGSSSGFSTPVRVQGTSCAANTGVSSITCTLTVTAGNTIIVSAGYGAGRTFTSCTDTQSNTFASITATISGNTQTTCWAAVASSGSDVVTVTISGSTNIMGTIDEFSGVAVVSPLDQDTQNTLSSGTSLTIGPFTTTNSNDLIYTAATGPNNVPAIASPYTTAAHASSFWDIVSAYRTVTSIGSYSATWTQSSGSMFGTLIALKAAASTGQVADLIPFNASGGATLAAIGPNGNYYYKDGTAGKCISAASPAVCGVAGAGLVAVPASGTTLVVDDSSVTATSLITPTFNSSLGTALSVTCNTTINQPTISAITAGVSFTITMSGSITTNPDCISFTIQ